ncbi:hypothetical protein Slin_1896 [Spirosoma linguale DSM 74]|uniref:Uncharacterized protein n=1 Tax=Spirosoma linguale (strain ATCC 33905 / DSM 74 / LMG 10896 / Claus 1) TaxID=504472 RepID=D2QBR2_SPILD|nr:hypothetical protein Slin_1896 [Spirosoma linguale DSM 74]
MYADNNTLNRPMANLLAVSQAAGGELLIFDEL